MPSIIAAKRGSNWLPLHRSISVRTFSCGMTARTYGFSIDGTTITTEKIMAANPRRVAELHLEIKFPEGSAYSDKEKKLIENAAKTCPVANSLHPDIKKNVEFVW